MLSRLLCAFLVVSMTVTTLPPPAEAQFGIRRAFKKVVRAPARILPGVAAPVIGGAILFGGPFRTAFGVIAAVAVGAVIFDALSKSERREVARRSKVVVAKDPDQRVTDVYTSKDGTKQVTMVAEPTQKAVDLKSDPAILVAADTVVAPDANKGTGAPSGLASDTSKASDAQPPAVTPEPDKKATPAAKPVVDEGVVRISEIPPDTQCRKVTTQLELRKKKDQDKADDTKTNTAIFCQTAPGEWKPAST